MTTPKIQSKKKVLSQAIETLSDTAKQVLSLLCQRKTKKEIATEIEAKQIVVTNIIRSLKKRSLFADDKTMRVKETVLKALGVEKPLSNKAQVYVLWKDGETGPEALHTAINGAVELKTIKNWLTHWANGHNFPSIAGKA